MPALLISLWRADAELLLWIQENLRIRELNEFFCFYTGLGNHGELWIALLLLLFFFSRRKALTAAAALLAAFVVTDIVIKPLVGRIRPFLAVRGLEALVDPGGSFSFPSGHSSTSLAVGYVLFRLLPLQYGLPLLFLAVLMALSRLYVGVHYPSDVAFGMLVGIVVGEICLRLARTREGRGAKFPR